MVEPHFSFLEAHGFRLSAMNDRSAWETWVQFTSDVSAVRVTRSNEFVRVDVHLIRLVAGDVPAYPSWVTSESLNWALLDNVLEARSPALLKQAVTLGGLSDDKLDHQLAFWASALASVAPEFLDGDLSALSEAGSIVRERVREHPQQVTVWVPDDAPPDTVANQVQNTAAVVPPEVNVIGRRYRRRASSRRQSGAKPGEQDGANSG